MVGGNVDHIHHQDLYLAARLSGTNGLITIWCGFVSGSGDLWESLRESLSVLHLPALSWNRWARAVSAIAELLVNTGFPSLHIPLLHLVPHHLFLHFHPYCLVHICRPCLVMSHFRLHIPPKNKSCIVSTVWCHMNFMINIHKQSDNMIFSHEAKLQCVSKKKTPRHF